MIAAVVVAVIHAGAALVTEARAGYGVAPISRAGSGG
jgi:hypothetical protein